MEFYLGQPLRWIPIRVHECVEAVTVVEIKTRGQVRLSNGWVVDEEGRAEGTFRRPGGNVEAV